MAAQLAERLVSCGVPVAVLSTSQQAYQPEVSVRNYRWSPDTGVVETMFKQAQVEGPAYLESPLKASRDLQAAVRVPLLGPVDAIPYPICRELAASGHTDYFIQAMPEGVATYLSVATRDSKGFSEDDIAVFHGVLPSIMLRLELYCSNYALESLLNLYLGGNASQRVLQGAFRLGGTEDIDAVIWMCDMRGFTAMTENSATADVLATLNAYFSCIVRAVQGHGGEVLKFIGDAVLAIFPVGLDSQDACRRAMRAAREAFTALDADNVRRAQVGSDPLLFGLGLHLGRVSYGNIGADTRLDFTVIGPAVNETARIESLCSPLGRRFLTSKDFSDSAKNDDLVSIGRHALKGVSAEKEIYTIESM